MATSNTLIDMDVKPNSVTYGVFTVSETVTDKEGNQNTRTVLKATQSEKALEKAEKEQTLLFKQSFSFDIPGTMAGINSLEIPEEEKVNIFRQGLTAKVGRGIVSALEEQDEQGNPVFQPTEGNFDARPYAAEESGRRNLSEADKAMKMIKNLSPELKAQLLAMISAQSAPAA